MNFKLKILISKIFQYHTITTNNRNSTYNNIKIVI